MRKLQVKYIQKDAEAVGNITYPEYWCYAFGVNTITLDLPNGGSKTVYLHFLSEEREHTLSVSLFNGKASVYISRVLQLFFDDLHKRARVVKVSVEFDSNILTRDIELSAIYAGIQLGERYGCYKNTALDVSENQLTSKRSVVWFRKFPFTVSMFGKKEQLHVFGTKRVAQRTAEGLTEYTMQAIPDNYADRRRINEIVDDDVPGFSVSVLKYSAQPQIVYNRTANVLYAHAVDADGYYTAYEDNQGRTIRLNTQSKSGTITAKTGQYAYNDRLVFIGKNGMSEQRDEIINTDAEGIFEVSPEESFSGDIVKAGYHLSNDELADIYAEDLDAPKEHYYEDVNLVPCDDEAGAYLRWIDKYGLVQYYLFVRGEEVEKSKQSSTALEGVASSHIREYGVFTRNQSVNVSQNLSCCAVSLNEETVNYVKTIKDSVHVDMYLGTTRIGEPLWLPVTISDSSYKLSAKTKLADYEIVIELPNKLTQSR